MISFFWKDEHICLAVSREPELGLLVRAKKNVLTQAKWISSRPVTWLLGLMYSIVAVALIILIKG